LLASEDILTADNLTVRWPENPGPTPWKRRVLISPDELTTAWVQLFGRIPWKSFVTLTFDPKRNFSVNQATASREAWEWCCSLGRMFRRPVAWLYATESGHGDRWHAHALITDLSVEEIQRAAEPWRIRNGMVHVRAVSDGQRAVLYTAKGVPKGVEVQWSDTVARYKNQLLPDVVVRLTCEADSDLEAPSNQQTPSNQKADPELATSTRRSRVPRRGVDVNATMSQLLTFSVVAKRTQLSESFWRKAVRRRLLPFIKIGRAVRLRQDDVVRFLEERTHPAREATLRPHS
jgi:excisionase family DNA binding protein